MPPHNNTFIPRQYEPPEVKAPLYTPEQLKVMEAEAEAMMKGTDGGAFRDALTRDSLVGVRILADLAVGRHGFGEDQEATIQRFIAAAEKTLKALAPSSK